jgi:hypothetical protein
VAFAESRLRHDDTTVTRTPDLVRWGPVFAGVIIGLGFFALLCSLWFAIAFADGWISDALAWFVGVTAAVSLLIAGWIAGALAGVRGTLAGLVNGIAAWGLLFILSVAAVLPGAANLADAGMAQGTDALGPTDLTVGSAMWTGFWSLLVGLVLAAAGGIAGGRMNRPVMTGDERQPTEPVPTPRSVPGQEHVPGREGRVESADERGDARGRY